MSEPIDPFDDDEMVDLVHQFAADQVNGAVSEASEEINDAVTALETLTARLLELIPRPAVVNLVTSMALGTAITATYGDSG
jgi:hypothetical protein